MAPIKPTRLATKRTKSSFPTPTSTFTSTKRDKRIMKHSVLVSKARASSDKPTGIKKRRRPTKKLSANISSLGDALPEEVIESTVPSQSSKITNEAGAARMSSLKIKKGAKKRLHKVVMEEKERFEKNLAVLTQGAPTAATGDGSTATPVPDSRWAALRRHLENTVSKG